MKKTIFLFFLALPFLIFAQEYKPILRVSKGQEFKYQTSIKTDITQSMAGQEMKTTATVNFTQLFSIEDVLADGGILALTSTWDLVTKNQNPMMDTTISISGKVGDVSRSSYTSLGKFLKTEITEKSEAAPGLSSNMSSGSTSSLFIEFPAGKLKPGDKWSTERTDSMTQEAIGGSMVITNKTEFMYTGKAEAEDKIAISYTASVEISGTGNMQGMDLSIEGTGARAGSLILDKKTGVVQSDKGTQELDMNIGITGPANMTIPMTQKIETSSVLIK